MLSLSRALGVVSILAVEVTFVGAQAAPAHGVLSSFGGQAFPGPAALAGALPGGRVVADGPFLFYATLYHDAALRVHGAYGAWNATDVPGVGVRLLFLYRGPTMRGSIPVLWDDEGDTHCVGEGYNILRRGERGGRNAGGLVLPRGARPARRLGYGMGVYTPRGRYGVVIRFTLRGVPGAWTVDHVAVRSGPHRMACPRLAA